MNHFYRKLSGVVQDVSSGGSIVKIDPFADKDIHELALSFNNLMEEIEEKDKQISELASKDSLPEIFKFGVDLIKENRIDEAENVFSTLVLLKPGAFASTFNLGVVLAKKKKYSEALNIFYKAAEINPSHGMTVQYISKIEKMFTNGKS